jgi:L-arabinose transport system substrate-binding protein
MYRPTRLARIVAIAALAGIVASAGCAQAAKKSIVIAGIYKALDQGWFQDTSAAAEKTALKLGAKEYIKLDASMNPDKYMNALETVIARKVDGLIVCIPDQALSKVTVDKCKAAGIPVLADDDALILDGKKLAPSFELDAFLVGRQMGQWLVDTVKKGNLVKVPAATAFLSLTMLTVNSCVPRSQGYEAAWKAGAFAKLPIINTDYNGETEKAFNAVSATINANPKIKTWFVCAPNDEGAQGAVRALEQAGLDKNAIVVGLGGYLAKDEFKKPYSAFKASAYIDPVTDGETVATAMMDKIQKGKEIFAEYKKPGEDFGMYPLGAKMVTAADYKAIMGKAAN